MPTMNHLSEAEVIHQRRYVGIRGAENLSISLMSLGLMNDVSSDLLSPAIRVSIQRESPSEITIDRIYPVTPSLKPSRRTRLHIT